MKKLALLLGALTLVSGAAYAKEVVPVVEEVAVVEEAPVAQPMLRVTGIGQYLEFDNDSGSSDIGETVFFGNTVDLAYGDNWTFQLLAAKTWNMDTDEGIHGNGHRIELGGWRHFENVSLGFKWRGQSDYDRYYGRVKYNYGMFSGWTDLVYQSNNSEGGSADNWYSEGMPVAVTVGPVTLGYYYEWFDYMDEKAGTQLQSSLEHQVRLMFPIYTGEKLTVSGEYRYTFAYDEDYAVKTGWQEKTVHAPILNVGYAFTDNFSVNGYYRYDIKSYDGQDDAKDADDNYYGEFYIGWNYTF